MPARPLPFLIFAPFLALYVCVLWLEADTPCNDAPITPSSPPAHVKEFKEILTSRPNTNLNQSCFQIRVTDNLTFFKIDSSTNELPLSEIDFSLTPGTPESNNMCTAHKSPSPSSQMQKKQAQLLTMRRMESGDEGDFMHKLREIRRMSPLATNERPLTCNCSGHLSATQEELVQPHAHSKSETNLCDMGNYTKISSPPLAISNVSSSYDCPTSFEEEIQISSSAPASLLSGEFLTPAARKRHMDSLKAPGGSPTNSPTASTLELCEALDNSNKNSSTQHSNNNSNNKHAQSLQQNPQIKRKMSNLVASQSAPVIAELNSSSPFKFPTISSFRQFDPIAENAPASNNTASYNLTNPFQELDMDLLPTTNQAPNSSSSNQLTDDLTPAQRPHHMHYHHHIHHHHHHHHYHIHPHAGHYRLYSLSSRPSTINTTTSTTNTTNPSNSSSSNLLLSASHDNDNDLNETNNDEFPISSASFFPTTITITTATNTLRPTPPCITINDDHTPYNNTHAPSPYKKLQKTISLDYSSTPPSNIFDNYNDHENNATTDPIISSIINNPPITDTTTDNTVTSTSSSSSVSSRRQRHSIAGQMSYMKMLGFGGFSKKMTTSANSLFSTAVISGSSSAPNLRDMIPVSSSVFPLTVLDGFGGVPPIRPLETLHNALSLKQLDTFLEKMTSAPLFKTPTCTPPKNPSTPLSMMTTITDEDICSATASTPTNNICRCNDNSILNEKNPERCGLCGYQIRNAVPDAESTPVAAGGDQQQQQQRLQTTNPVAAGSSLWSKQSSIASSITEPSSPAISDTYSLETPSCEMSISLTSNEGGNYSLPPSSATAAKLARFFPRLDGDLNTVSVYTPMNLDSLDSNDTEFNMGAIGGGGGGGPGGKSACLTPVSFNMDLSIVANKGSLTLSVDGFEDEDATPSAATTPSLPHDEGPQLEMCYCCDGHAESDQPPDDDAEQSTELFSSMRNKRLDENEPKVTCCCHADEEPLLSAGPNFGDPVPPLLSIRKASDTISPKIQKQISLFESGDIDRQKDYAALHASINIPQPNSLQLKQDARLRKFENLTQSTSNSNFPFESNTLKRVPNNVEDFVDVNLTQSCINLKTSDVVASDLASGGGSPQHKASQSAIFRPITMPSEMGSASGPASPRPGALIVKEKFIEPPKRITRSFHGKTQSMDADFLFNEFLLVPAQAPNTQQNSSSSEAGSSSTSPSTNRPNKRFTTTKVLDEALQDVDKV